VREDGVRFGEEVEFVGCGTVGGRLGLGGIGVGGVGGEVWVMEFGEAEVGLLYLGRSGIGRYLEGFVVVAFRGRRVIMEARCCGE